MPGLRNGDGRFIRHLAEGHLDALMWSKLSPCFADSHDRDHDVLREPQGVPSGRMIISPGPDVEVAIVGQGSCERDMLKVQLWSLRVNGGCENKEQ